MRYIIILILGVFILNAHAMNDTAEVITAGTAQGLVNAGVAIYMQGQGMNPQFVNSPTGPYVVPGNAGSQPQANHSAVSQYEQQNSQDQKQAFFNGN